MTTDQCNKAFCNFLEKKTKAFKLSNIPQKWCPKFGLNLPGNSACKTSGNVAGIFSL